MHRLVLATAALALTTACSSEPDIAFTLVSVLPEATSGVALRDDAVANAGMSDQVCTLDVTTAGVIGDLDPNQDGAEYLLDAWGDRALATSGHSLYSLPRTRLDEGVRERWELAPLAGRLLDRGAVVVSEIDGECGVTWTAGGAHLAAVVPQTRCATTPAFAVERDTGVAWLADGNSLARIEPDGSFARWDAVHADRIAWDPANQQLVLGAIGSSWLQAIDADGQTLWTRSLTGSLVDVEVASDTGVTSVMVEGFDGTGDLELLDGLGDWLATHPLPGTADVIFSDDAGALALATPDATYFYVVDEDVDLFDVPAGVPGDSADLVAVGAGVGASVGAILGTAVFVASLGD